MSQLGTFESKNDFEVVGVTFALDGQMLEQGFVVVAKGLGQLFQAAVHLP